MQKGFALLFFAAFTCTFLPLFSQVIKPDNLKLYGITPESDSLFFGKLARDTYNMPKFIPDKNIEYKISEIIPDSIVDYKIQEFNPDKFYALPKSGIIELDSLKKKLERKLK